MPLKGKETELLIGGLLEKESWEDAAFAGKVESFLRKALRSPVRKVLCAESCLAYHLDLKKTRDVFSTGCIIFMVKAKPGLDAQKLYALIENMKNIISEENLGENPHLIYLFNHNREKKEYFKDFFKESFISNSGGLKSLLNRSNPKLELLKIIENKKQMFAECPFHYLGPCKPEMFFGRSALIREILLGAQNGYAIAGGRRIGKSSFLIKLQHESQKKKYESKKYRPLYMDCSNFAGFRELIREITRKLFPHYYYKKERSAYQFKFEDILSRGSELRGQKLLLLLDEMDSIVDKPKTNSDDIRFFNSLRSQVNHGRLKLVITGFRKISDMINSVEHPFYNICEGIHMETLACRDVRELISLSFLRCGIDLKPKNEIIERIWDYTSGHPSVVQFIAKKMFDKREKNLITLKTLENILRDGALRKYILDNFIMNTSNLERLICLLIIDEDEFDFHMVHDKISSMKIMLRNEDKKILSAMGNLLMNNIFIMAKDKYRFLNSLLVKIIREYYASPGVISLLKRELQYESQF